MPLSQVEHIMRRVLRSGITIRVAEKYDTFIVVMNPNDKPDAVESVENATLEDALLNCAALVQRNAIM